MAKVIHIQKPPPQMCAEFIPNAAESTVHDSFQSGLTAQIARRSVRILLEEHGFRIQRILASIDTHEDDTVDRKFVERTAELIKRVIKNSPMELPTVAQLAQEHWLIHAGNVYSEYMQLSQQLFQDGINWGRLIAFIGFTSTYCLYAMEQGIQDSIVESVAAWMVQVLGRDHVEWFQQHSWVSRRIIV